MRILHLADVHFDTLHRARSEDARRRLRDATRLAFTRAMDLAIHSKVDAVIVAGDLFDGPRLSLGTEVFLRDALLPLGHAGIPFFYATGNHDPTQGIAGSDRIAWPPHVHRFLDATPQTIKVVRGATVVGTVTGVGHVTDRESRDLSKNMHPPAGRTRPAVAILHTQVTGSQGEGDHDRYAPSELASLRASGFDYWALGHVHVRQTLSTLPGITYPGNLQGRSPRETGAKGALLVELEAPGVPPKVDFHELASIRWERIALGGLDEIGNAEALQAHIEAHWDSVRRSPEGPRDREVLLRIVLSGPSPLYAPLADEAEAGEFGARLAARLGVLEVELRLEGLRPAVDPADALQRPDAAGEALRLIRSLGADDGPSPSERLGIPAGALAGRQSGALTSQADLDAYLRELLSDGDRLALERFIARGEGNEVSS